MPLMLLRQVQLGLRELEHKTTVAAANTAAGQWGITGGSGGPAVPPEDLASLTGQPLSYPLFSAKPPLQMVLSCVGIGRAYA
jgi:hypothetical protein